LCQLHHIVIKTSSSNFSIIAAATAAATFIFRRAAAAAAAAGSRTPLPLTAHLLLRVAKGPWPYKQDSTAATTTAAPAAAAAAVTIAAMLLLPAGVLAEEAGHLLLLHLQLGLEVRQCPQHLATAAAAAAAASNCNQRPPITSFQLKTGAKRRVPTDTCRGNHDANDTHHTGWTYPSLTSGNTVIPDSLQHLLIIMCCCCCCCPHLISTLLLICCCFWS
jgi:hypothetical protein